MCEDHFKKHFKFCQLCCTIDIIICDSSNSYQKLDNFKVLGCKISVYHLASYSFWGNSSSLNLAIVANSITVFLHIVSAETILFWSQYINVRKLFKGGNYSRAETIWGNTIINVTPSITDGVHRNENLVEIIPVFSPFSNFFKKKTTYKSHYM